MSHAKKTIVVAMSGGVDSSVAAALLVREGYAVIGAYMKNWSSAEDVAGMACGPGCGWEQERADALRVAAVLGIPFHTFDFEKEYRERVVGYMVREYAAGRTPNPDVLCNREVKFDLFLKAAEALGADMIATGHYARVTQDVDGTFAMLSGIDENKDQTYFLHTLTQAQLSKTLFPIGHLPKSEVRALARKFALPTAEKKDSQGICFVGKVDLSEFLKDKIPQTPGSIVTTDGVKVGEHQGIAPFTIGQRHGLGIGGGPPYFVVRKDMAKNALVVARADDPRALLSDTAVVSMMHWIAGEAPALPLACEVRIRYRQPLQKAVLDSRLRGNDSEGGNDKEGDSELFLRFAEPQRAVSPGQFAVLYDRERCLGGGVIE